jgi:surface antigen
MATSKLEEFLAKARGELGQRERADGSTKYGSWYERAKSAAGFAEAAWCQMFISWLANEVGLGEDVIPRMAYTPWAAAWFKDRGLWGQTPRRGAIVYFDWGGSHDIAKIDHVGIVEAVRADGSIVTLEGNTADAVRRRVRRTGIAGYGYPKYPRPKPPKMPEGVPQFKRTLRVKTSLLRGDDVRAWQQKLHDRGWTIEVDGVYGTESAGVCSAYQRAIGLKPTGVVDAETWVQTWTWRP